MEILLYGFLVFGIGRIITSKARKQRRLIDNEIRRRDREHREFFNKLNERLK